FRQADRDWESALRFLAASALRCGRCRLDDGGRLRRTREELRLRAQPMIERLSIGTAHLLPDGIGALGNVVGNLRAHAVPPAWCGLERDLPAFNADSRPNAGNGFFHPRNLWIPGSSGAGPQMLDELPRVGRQLGKNAKADPQA